jgi:hypothetical protein
MNDEKPQASAPRPHRWHNDLAKAPASAAVSHRRQLFRLSLILMALVGAALAWLNFFRPYHDPALTTIAITQYTDPRWPPDAQAEQDGRALDAVLRHQKTGKDQDLFNTQIKPLLVGELQRLREGAPRDRPVVIHLCSLARTGGDGEVFVLPADAVPDDPKTWVPLTDILKRVGECPTPHKLLILDLTRPVADSHLGILSNNVAAGVQATLKDRADLPFFVLCACSPGQVSLVDEELGQSAFGHYLVEGLRGAADGYNSQGKTDGWVSVTELAAYVAAQVDGWAVRRGQRQTPYLWSGQAKDFSFPTDKAAAQRPEAENAGDKRTYPAALEAAWKQWEDWQREHIGDTAPWVLRRLEGKLLSFEQRWRSGLGEPAEKLPAELAWGRGQVQQVRDLVRPRHHRALAPEAAQRGIEPNKELVDKLRDLWKKWAAKAAAPAPEKDKPPAKAKPAEGDLGELKKEVAAELGKVRDPFALALAVWELASADDTESMPGRRAAVLVDWYRQYTPATARSYVEIRFLQRLAGVEATISPTLVRNALLMVRAAEQPIADPRVFPWIRLALTKAQAKRTEAERLLFAATPEERAKADAAVGEALRDLQEVEGLLPQFEEGFKLRAEALAFLPAYAPCLLHQLDLAPSPQRLQPWLDAVETARSLDQLLTAPAGGAGTVELAQLKDQLPRLTGRLRNCLEGLRPPLVVSRLRPRFAARWSNVNELDALLQLPWFTVQDDTPKKEGEPTPPFTRATLWQKRQEAARALLDEGRHQEAKPGSQPLPFDQDAASRQERERALARARVAITLLKFGGFSGADKLQEDWDHLNANPTDAGLQKLARGLFEAWNKAAPEQLKTLWENQEDAAAIRLVRILPAAYQKWPWSAAEVGANPEYRLWLQENQAVWRWLMEDCRLKSQKLDGAERSFCEDAAREYQRVLP